MSALPIDSRRFFFFFRFFFFVRIMATGRYELRVYVCKLSFVSMTFLVQLRLMETENSEEMMIAQLTFFFSLFSSSSLFNVQTTHRKLHNEPPELSNISWNPLFIIESLRFVCVRVMNQTKWNSVEIPSFWQNSATNHFKSYTHKRKNRAAPKTQSWKYPTYNMYLD